MIGRNICFKGVICKIISKLPLLSGSPITLKNLHIFKVYGYTSVSVIFTKDNNFCDLLLCKVGRSKPPLVLTSGFTRL